MPNGVKLKSTA